MVCFHNHQSMLNCLVCRIADQGIKLCFWSWGEGGRGGWLVIANTLNSVHLNAYKLISFKLGMMIDITESFNLTPV